MASILYLHGFHSSPQSQKSLLFKQQLTQSHPNIQLIAPQLPAIPEQAVTLITDLVEQHKQDLIGVVGSSLGGYFATYLHNQYRLPIVVVNPAVRPFELLIDYLGWQVHPITGEKYQLKLEYMDTLKRLYAEEVAEPDKVWLLQQEEDEVLDYRQALKHYSQCKIHFESGGSHEFEGFERFPSAIVDFLL